MPKVKSTRERILAAAFELISNRGYQGATTRDIAQRAGVAEVTIFRHFTNKENLFRETTQHYTTIPVLEELIPTIIDNSLEDGFSILVSAYLDRLSDSKSWIRIFQTELQQDPVTFRPVLQSFLDELYRVCSSYFAEISRRGSLTCCDPNVAARVFVMMCYGCFQIEEMQLGKSCKRSDNRPLVDAMVKIFCNGIGSRSPIKESNP